MQSTHRRAHRERGGHSPTRLSFAPADISANLKQAVSKAIAQKALLSLADKGLLTKKDYGKSPSSSALFRFTYAHQPLSLFRQADRLCVPPGEMSPVHVSRLRLKPVRVSLSSEQEDPDEEAQEALDSVDEDLAAIAQPLEDAKKKANKLQNGSSISFCFSAEANTAC